jgi:hypothetical protein
MMKFNAIIIVLVIVLVIALWIAFASAFASSAGAKKEVALIASERYFPDAIGLQWTYSGSVAKQIQRVSSDDYTNTAIVKGKTNKLGVPAVIFWESNQSNQGQAESYFSRDSKGISYLGGRPTTDFETQLVPFMAIPFPIVLGKTYLQVEKNNLQYDLDLDGDGQREKASARSEVTAVGLETVSTPAGIFNDTIKFQGVMTVWITLSRDAKRVPIVGKTAHWYAKDIGLVKQIEKLDFSEEIEGSPLGTITTEVLTEYIKPKSLNEGIFK